MNLHIGILERNDSLLGIQYKYMCYYEGKDRNNLKLNGYHEISIGILFARIQITVPGKKGA